MRMSDVLFEHNEARLVNDFGKKLIARVEADKSIPFGVRLAVKKVPANLSPEEKQKEQAKKIITRIAEKDPTQNKELTFWLVLNYVRLLSRDGEPSYGINCWEDIDSRAVPALLKFRALCRKPNHNPPLRTKDRNQFAGLPALESLLAKYPDEVAISNAAADAQKEQSFYASGAAILRLNTPELKVVQPKTGEASVFFGKGTRWCTAAENNNAFDRYNRSGNLFIVIPKGTSEKYQFHFRTKQVMDAEDRPIELVELFKKYPDILQIFMTQKKRNETANLDVNQKIAGCNNITIKTMQARSPNADPALLRLLARDKNITIRRLVSRNSATPPDALEFLLQDTDKYIVSNAIYNKNASPKMIRIAAEDKSKWPVISGHKNAPSDVLVKIADNSLTTPKSAHINVIPLLKNNALDSASLAHIVNKIILYLSTLPNLDSFTAENWSLHWNPCSMLAAAASNHVAASSTVLEKIIKFILPLSGKYIIHVFNDVAKNPNLSAAQCQLVYQEGKARYSSILENLATNPALPVGIMEELLNVSYNKMWLLLSANPNLPEKIIRQLANYGLDDKDANSASYYTKHDILYHLSGNPNLPPDLMYAFVERNPLRYPGIGILDILISNPAIPTPLLQKLSTDGRVGTYTKSRIVELLKLRQE